MSSYPLGGLVRQTDDIGSVELFDVVYDDGTYVPSAADALDPKGTLLGRITASGKVTPSDPAAVDGSQIPIAVLGSDVQADATPNDVFIRMIVGGRVRRDRLSRIDASAITDAVCDALRDFGIVAERTTRLTKYDN
jgi:hypothetical protein